MNRIPYTIAYVFIALLLTASSCFNGNDDGDNLSADYNSTLKGTYLIHQVGENSNGVYTSQIEVYSDGNGSGTYNILQHSQGNTTSSPQSYTYSVAADRTFTVNNGMGDDYGILSIDGSMFVIVDAQTVQTDQDGEIILSMGIKKDCATPPVLSGNYQIGQIAVDYSTGTQLYTSRVDLDFDTKLFSIVEHSLGHSGSGSFAIDVQADCTITVNNGIADDYGIVSSDGNIFVLVDAVQSGDGDNSIILAVGIKKSTNVDNSVLSGNYWLGQIAQNTSGVPINYSSQVTLSSQGNGSASAVIARHSLGYASNTVIPLSYVVNSDGSYSVNNGSGNDYGVISVDGEIFFTVDADHNINDTDNEIVFALGIKH